MLPLREKHCRTHKPELLLINYKLPGWLGC